MHLKPLPGVDSRSVSSASANGGRGRLVSVNSIRYCVRVAGSGIGGGARDTDKIEIEMDARHIVTHRGR